MSQVSTKDEWLSQADSILRQINTNRLNMKKLFPNKEHLQSKIKISKTLKMNFTKFFSKPVNSLVPIESITNLLKKANSVNIPPNNPIFQQLKKSNQKALMVQLRAKELVQSKNKTYNDVKYNMGEFFNIGITSKDAGKLKVIMDDNRRIELSLCENYLNLEELHTVKMKLFEQQGKQIDKSFENLIKEKEKKFRKIENQLESVLRSTSLTPEAMKNICLLLDQAEEVKFKLKQFRYICGIRDSFRWVHLLNKFLQGKDKSLSRFDVIAARIRKIDITPPLNLKILKNKLIGLIKKIEEESNMPLFKAILEPVRDVELTDDSIIEIIEFLKTSKWTLMVNKKLQEKDMRIAELREIIESVPEIKKRMKDESYLKVKKIFENAIEVDESINELLDDLYDFIKILDMAKDKDEVDGSWVSKFDEYRVKAFELCQVVDAELSFVIEIKENCKLNKVKAIIKVLEVYLKILNNDSIEKKQLKELKGLLLACDVEDLKHFEIIQKVLKFHSENLKIIRFFERLNENDSLEMGLRDDIIVVKNYEKIINQDDNMIDYGAGKGELKEKIELFENWEEKVDQICEDYNIEKVEREFDEFKNSKAADFVKQINQLKIELKVLSFKSIRVEKLLVLEWSVEALSLLMGSKKKMNVWLVFHKRSKGLVTISRDLLGKVEEEIALAEQLVIQGHEIYRENASYKDIRELKRNVADCRIDMSDELAIFKDRFQIEEELYKRINDVLDIKVKLRLVEIEKLTDDIKSSGIDFGDLRENLEKSLQVCRAFAVAIKEMKKSPTEIKRAKQTYVMLPLISPNFELMMEKLKEEEQLIEQMDGIINQTEEDEDFEKISELEMHLSHSKYYNFDESRLKLFKKKISILKKQSIKEEADFTISYVVIRSMRLESNELTKKHAKDKELAQLNYFISEIDNEARSFLQNLSSIKNYKTFDKIKNLIYKFIDISSEIKDLKTKCRLNIQRTTNLFEIEDSKVSTVSRLKGISGVPAKKKNSKKFQLNLMNLKKNISEKSPKAQVPAFNDDEVQKSAKKKISQKKFDMRALRINLLNNLKMEIQRNQYISETESEIKKIAAFIERTIFSKTLDGGYEIKMRRMIRLFAQLVKMKKITFLVTLKNYDMNILVFLMEKSPLILQQYESDKDRLLTDMGFGDILKGSNKPNDGYLGKRSPEGQIMSNPVKKIKNSSSGVKIVNSAESKKPNKGARKNIDNVMKHKGRIVASLKTSIRNISTAQRPLRKKEIDILSNSVDVMNDNIRIKKRSETGGGTTEEETRRMYKDILLKPHMADTMPKSSITDAPAWKIFKGDVSLQTNTVSSDFKDISFITLNSILDIENTPKISDPLVLKGSVGYKEFNSYMQKLFRKSSKVINLSLGFLYSDNSPVLHRMNGIFTPENSAFFVKYTDFSKILVFPKSLLNPNWSHFFKFNFNDINKLKCNLFYIVVLNLSILNSGKYPIPEFINPEPIQDLSFVERVKEVELTPESSELNSPHSKLFKGKEYQDYKNGKSSNEKISNSLLNVLKYGGMSNKMSNKAAIGVEVDSPNPRQRRNYHRKDSFDSQLSNPDLVQYQNHNKKSNYYRQEPPSYYDEQQGYYPQMQGYSQTLGKRHYNEQKRTEKHHRKEPQTNPLITMLGPRKAIKNRSTPYDGMYQDEIEVKGFNDIEASAKRKGKKKGKGTQRRLNQLFRSGTAQQQAYYQQNKQQKGRFGSFDVSRGSLEKRSQPQYVNPLGKVNSGGSTVLYKQR